MLGINVKRGSSDIIKKKIQEKILKVENNSKINCSGLLQYKINKDGLYVYLENAKRFVFSKSDNWIIPNIYLGYGDSFEESAIKFFKCDVGKSLQSEKLISLGEAETEYKKTCIYAFNGKYKFNKSKNESTDELDIQNEICFFHIDEAKKIINGKHKIFIDRLEEKFSNNEEYISSK
jgi:hypothetical protein